MDTGVSESIFSEHYDDLMKLHMAGKYIELVHHKEYVITDPTKEKRLDILFIEW